MTLIKRKTLKKAISTVTAITTVVWLSGMSMFAITPAIAAVVDGSLVKSDATNSDGSPTLESLDVYIVKVVGTKQFKRLVLNPTVFNSYGHLNWEDIQTVSQSVMDGYTTSGLVRVDTDPDEKVYAMTPDGDIGSKSWVNLSATDFLSLTGSEAGDSIYTINSVDGGNYNTVGDVTTVTELETYYSAGTLPVAPVGSDFAVALSASTPASGNIVAGQAIADLAHFNFNNGTAAPVAVTSVSLTRNGYSVDSDLTNVYLYDGDVRITDSATVSAGVITFNDSTGLFTVPANSSMTIAVKSDIVTAFAGTVGVTLTSYTVGGTAIATNLAGNQMSGITVTLTTADFPTQTISPTATTASPSTDYIVWSGNVNIGTNDVSMKSFRLRQIGSADVSDIQNFRLYANGVQAGTAVANLGSDGYIAFDLSSAPVTLKSGTCILKVVADIVGGSSRTFSFSLRAASDLNIIDSQVGVNVLATYNSLSFTPLASTSATIDSGSLTLTLKTDSPSGTIVLGGSNVLLGQWDVKAYGEQMKVENLYVRVIPSVAGTTTLRNGKFFYNGVQIGSTASVSTAAAGTQYTFGSAFTVTPGTPGVLEFYADNYAATGTAIVDGNTFQAQVCNTACNATPQTGLNVQRKVSLTYGSYPVAVSSANVLTATVGTLTMAKDQAYGAQTIVVPQTAQLLGQFTLTSGSSDVINADTITATITSASTAGSTDITSLYVTYGEKTTTIKPTITAAATTVASVNTWSIGEEILANETMTVKVYGDIASTMATSTATIDTSLLVSGTSSSSTAVTTGTVVGQQMTASSSGTLTVTLDSSTPIATQVVAGSVPVEGSLRIKLASADEDVYVKKISLTVDTVLNSPAIAYVDLMAATTSGGTYTSVGTAQTVVNDGILPGYVTWNLTGVGRILVARNSSVYLKAVPTYVSSGQASVSNLTPKLILTELQAEGISVLSAGGAGTNTINSTGIIIQANSSATYVDSTADIDGAIALGTTTTIYTDNGAGADDGITFAIGDIIFVDNTDALGTGAGDGNWNAAYEELMVVLSDTVGGTESTLVVERGAFGTTATDLDDNDDVYRLSGTVASYPNASIIGNSQTVLNTKLALTLASASPSGATSAGTGKIVFSFTATASNNAADVALNTATLNYVDITTAKSGSTGAYTATINNLKVYPSEYDTNAAYATTCGALSTTEWRCTLSSTGSTNQIDENTSRTYIVRGDTAYAANGSIDISIATLGTSSVSTNDVSWTDGVTTPIYWTSQASTSVSSPSPLSSVAASGTIDATDPDVDFITINGTPDNAWTDDDTVVVIFSEAMDPTLFVTTGGTGTLVPDGTYSVTAIPASTGYLTRTAANPSLAAVPGLFASGMIIGGDTTGVSQAAAIVKLMLSTDGTTLTIYVTTAGADTASAVAESLASSAPSTGTLKDVNGNALANTAVVPTGTGF